MLGLTGIPPDAVPTGAVQAVQPAPKPGDIVGVVWRDFKPGGGKAGVVEKGELGLPGVTVAASRGRREDGPVDDVGRRRHVRLQGVAPGTYQGGDRRRRPSRSRSAASPGWGRS